METTTKKNSRRSVYFIKMKKKDKKELNEFIDKTSKSFELEVAPKDFVESVMAKVALQQAHATDIRYAPLISNTVWVCILALVISLFTLIGVEKKDVLTDWFSVLRLNTVGTINLMDVFPDGVAISDSTVYALVGLLVFMGVQVWYLKRLFAKRQVLL
jgi:hypothetical protein